MPSEGTNIAAELRAEEIRNGRFEVLRYYFQDHFIRADFPHLTTAEDVARVL